MTRRTPFAPDQARGSRDPRHEQSPAEAEEEREATETDAGALGQPSAKGSDRPGPAPQAVALPPTGRRADAYLTGLTGALGVATAYLLFRAVVDVASVLLLVGLSLFLAVGFDPFVARLSRRLPRVVAVLIVVAVLAGVLVLFVANALPPMTHEVDALTAKWPTYRHDIVTGKGLVGRAAAATHLNNFFKTGKSATAASTSTTSSLSLSLVGGILGAGKLVLSAVTSVLVVIVLTLYFMVTLPSVRDVGLRFVPASRRDRTAALTDQAFLRVGGYVLGDLLTSLVAGIGTTVWATVFGLPYPLLLGLLVALLDLIPIVGSTVGGVVVSMVALSVSLPVALATAIFYVGYRFLEDQVLNPLVMRRTVRVSAGVTIIATLVGGSLLGILGALVAVPVAATIQVVFDEITWPSLERG